MKNRNKAFSCRATQHIYQRCKDHGVLFYTEKDRIVYYTLCACFARKYEVKVSAASLMFTHTHQSVIASSLETLRSYLRDTGSSFARLYNHHYKRSGPLFEKHPGYSQKNSSKDIRSNIAYVYNNHVEKGLCSSAIQERWSFLAYAVSDHPFSQPIDRKHSSNALKRVLKLVDRRINKLKSLEYVDLDRIIPSLSKCEYEQFIDYVISHYALIDYSIAISHFGNLESMLLAIDSTTGGEYEIQEDYSKLKDDGFIELIKEAENSGYLERVFEMLDNEKMNNALYCFRRFLSHPDHIRRFFHMDFRVLR